MPYKIGGGKELEYYSENDGRYAENINMTLDLLNSDIRNIKSHLSGIFISNIHFPDEKISNEEYCTLFVHYIRNYVTKVIVDKNKYNYLFTYKKANDKSNFLITHGFSTENINELDYLLNNIDFQKIEFSRMSNNHLLCTYDLNTNRKGVLIHFNIVYELQKDLTLRFVTLVPGGK